MDQDYILEMEGISKSFPGVKALNNVQLERAQGHGARAHGRKRGRQVHADEGA